MADQRTKREALRLIAFPVGLVALGGMIIGGSLMSHTPWLEDFGWVGGTLAGTMPLALGVQLLLEVYPTSSD